MAICCRCRPSLGIYPGPLFLAAGFGLLSAIAFAVPPLGRARAIPPASLLRETVVAHNASQSAHGLYRGSRRWPALGIAGLMLRVAPSPLFAGGISGRRDRRCLDCCGCLAEGMTRAIAQAAPPALAAAAVGAGRSHPSGRGHRRRDHRAGAGPDIARDRHPDRTHHSAGSERRASQPRAQLLLCRYPARPGREISTAPSKASRRRSDYKRTPMIRGRITSLNGVPSAEAKVSQRRQMGAESGDRGITYAATPPTAPSSPKANGGRPIITAPP